MWCSIPAVRIQYPLLNDINEMVYNQKSITKFQVIVAPGLRGNECDILNEEEL